MKRNADELTPIDDLYDANEQLRREVNIREIRMRQAETRQDAAERERDELRAELAQARPDPQERGGASVEVEGGPRFYSVYANDPLYVALVKERDTLQAELAQARAANNAVTHQLELEMQETEFLRAELEQARADTDDLVGKAWDAAKAGIDQLTQERDQARAENQALRGVVNLARDWVSVSGHNMPYWKDCEADPPESCTWLVLSSALAALDGQAQPQERAG